MVQLTWTTQLMGDNLAKIRYYIFKNKLKIDKITKQIIK